MKWHQLSGEYRLYAMHIYIYEFSRNYVCPSQSDVQGSSKARRILKKQGTRLKAPKSERIRIREIFSKIAGFTGGVHDRSFTDYDI